MAVNPMQRKARQSFLLGMLLMLVIAGIVIGILFSQIMKFKEAEDQTKAASKMVYILKKDIQAGNEISAGDYESKSIVTEMDSKEIPAAITGKMTKIELKKGTILTSSMLMDSTDTLEKSQRIEEFNMLTLPTDLNTGDYVDIRFVLPNGQDYIVISKKRVIKSSENTIFVKLAEDEILTMSNAIVEAYITEGSMLRAVKYSEPGIQEAATPTYVASADVIELINKDSNIEQTAMAALVDRYNKTSSLRMQINNALQPNMEDAAGKVSDGFNTQITKAQAERARYVETLGKSDY